MRILLTGADGMVGTNILEHPSAARHEWLTPLIGDLDLCNRAALAGYFETHRPDLVIHAAGKVGGIQANMKDPLGFFLENFDMGRNLIQCAHAVGVKRFLNLGSSCMYPRNAPNPLREELILQGELEPTNEGYALAKIGVQRVGDYLHRADPTFLFKTLVPCNMFGRFDKFDPKHSHMIPSVIVKIHDAIATGKDEVEIWGDGTARREFMYAGDLAECVFRGLERFEALPDLMNVGLGRDWTINEYYAIVAEVLGFKGRFTHDTTRPVGMARKVVDITRQTAFGFASTTSLQAGIAAAHRYYLDWKGKNA